MDLRVVAIDRDLPFLRDLRDHTRELGWTLLPRGEATTAQSLLVEAVEAVVLDIRTLGSGWLYWLRQQTPSMPGIAVVVCTAPATLEQRLHGLEAGADDWLTKPCSLEELASRVAGIVRVRQPSLTRDPIHCAGLEVRPDLYDAYFDGQPAALTRREFDVLLCLARRKGTTVGRDQIYQRIWGHPMPGGDRALDSTIRKLRAKLKGLAPGRAYIHTERHVGYRLAGETALRAR